jgi:hypothetical protein
MNIFLYYYAPDLEMTRITWCSESRSLLLDRLDLELPPSLYLSLLSLSAVTRYMSQSATITLPVGHKPRWELEDEDVEVDGLQTVEDRHVRRVFCSLLFSQHL